MKELKVKFVYLNFDDESLFGISSNDLRNIEQAIYEVYGNDVNYLIFDEIHNVKGWKLFVSMFLIVPFCSKLNIKGLIYISLR